MDHGMSSQVQRYEDLSTAIFDKWFAVHGAPKLLITDQEMGLAGAKGTDFLARNAVQLKLKAKGTHASIVERHHDCGEINSIEFDHRQLTKA